MATASFQGLKVLALENRRAVEIAKLIRTYGGDPTVISAMREVPRESNSEALEFAGRLLRGEFDLVVFLTGVGIRRLLDVVEPEYGRDHILDALRRVKVASRGPKPASVLRELGVPVAVTAAEPCTWREMIQALDESFGPSLEGLSTAVQEYGTSNPELLHALTEHNVPWMRVPVYQWALPEDLEPLQSSIRTIIAGEIDVILFLSAVQVEHLFQVAEIMHCTDALRDAFHNLVVLSIGPSTSAELARHSIRPDFEPSHPKMGFLMNEASSCAVQLLEQKRGTVIHATLAARLQVSAQNALPVSSRSSDTSSSLALKDGILPTRNPTHSASQTLGQSKVIEMMHAIGRSVAGSDPLHSVLDQIVVFIETLLRCDSCFIYTLEDNQLVLRASKNPHPGVVDHIGLRIGQGITGWVAEHKEPVCIDSGALQDPRFESLQDLPEDSFEAFLSVPILARGSLVGVINVQHRNPHHYTPWEVQIISMVGFFVGAEIEMASLETENSALSTQLETRKLVERAKGVLQRDLNIDEAQAYRMMQKESRQRRKNMREIAEAIILSEELRRTKNPSK